MSDFLAKIKDFCIKKQDFLILLLISCTMLGYAIYLKHCDPLLSRDSVLYVQAMELWNQSGNPESILNEDPNCKAPLFPLFLMKLLVPLGFSIELSALCINLAAAFFLPLLMFGIAEMLTKNRKIAYIAAVLTAFHPTILSMAIQAQRDTLYLFFLAGFLYLFFAALMRKKYLYWGAAGALFALGVLTRYEMAEFLPIPLAILLWEMSRKKITFQYLLRSCLIFFCSMILAGIFAMYLSDTLSVTENIYWTRIHLFI